MLLNRFPFRVNTTTPHRCLAGRVGPPLPLPWWINTELLPGIRPARGMDAEDARRPREPGSPLFARTASAATGLGLRGLDPPGAAGQGPMNSRHAAAPSPFRKAANRFLLDSFHSLTAPLRMTWEFVAGAPGRRTQQDHRTFASDIPVYARHPKLALDPFAARRGPTAAQSWFRRAASMLVLFSMVIFLYSYSPLSFRGSKSEGVGDAASDRDNRPPPAIGSRPWYRIPYTDADIEVDAAVARNVEAGNAVLRRRAKKRAVPEVPDGRRYMLYMTHSGRYIPCECIYLIFLTSYFAGLNNQRVSFSNALLISHTLNLTLVVPPAMLGDPIPHRPFAVEQRLYSETLLSNIEPTKCRFVKRPKKWKDMKLLTCIDKNGRWNRIMLPWEELFNLEPLKKLGLDWITTDQFMDEVGVDVRDHRWMEGFDRLNQTVVFEDDEHVWAYRFAENGFKPPWRSKKGGSSKSNKPPGPRQPVTLGKYRGPLLNLTQLKEDLVNHKTFRILHFGSIFGSDRVIMSSKYGMELAKAVEEAMLYSNPTLHHLTDGLVDRLGGRSGFLGLHLRVGEARGGGEMFNSKPDETVAAVLNEIEGWLESAKKNATLAGKKGKRGGGTKNLKGLWKKVTDPSRRPDASKRKKSEKAAKLAGGGGIAVGSVPAPRRKEKPVVAEAPEGEPLREDKAPDIDEARPPRFNNIGASHMPVTDSSEESTGEQNGAAAAKPAEALSDEAKAAFVEAAATLAGNGTDEVTSGAADAAQGAIEANADNSTEARIPKAPASHALSPYLPADPSTVSDPESLLEICKHLHATSKNPWQFPIIYIATDALDARNNPSFRIIFDKFPCTFTLGDFSHLLGGLAKIKDVDFSSGALVPAQSLTRKTAHLYLPLIDQMVVSQGKTFVGTPKSTFSTFAARLHHHWVQLGQHPTKPKSKGKGRRKRAQ